MIHLITVAGQGARNFYLNPMCISDFKSLIRAVTSGRVTIVSTKFRSDLFYSAKKPEHEAILKLWALYANTDLSKIALHDIHTYIGRKNSFTCYFQSINQLAQNWALYRLYQKAFHQTYHNDQQNPITAIIVGCDQHLIHCPSITRGPLFYIHENMKPDLTEDTFALAMHIINNETHAN